MYPRVLRNKTAETVSLRPVKIRAFLSIKGVSIVRTPTSVTKMISRKYKFHALERKTADFFEPSEILFSQKQC